MQKKQEKMSEYALKHAVDWLHFCCWDNSYTSCGVVGRRAKHVYRRVFLLMFTGTFCSAYNSKVVAFKAKMDFNSGVLKGYFIIKASWLLGPIEYVALYAAITFVVGLYSIQWPSAVCISIWLHQWAVQICKSGCAFSATPGRLVISGCFAGGMYHSLPHKRGNQWRGYRRQRGAIALGAAGEGCKTASPQYFMTNQHKTVR